MNSWTCCLPASARPTAAPGWRARATWPKSKSERCKRRKGPAKCRGLSFSRAVRVSVAEVQRDAAAVGVRPVAAVAPRITVLPSLVVFVAIAAVPGTITRLVVPAAMVPVGRRMAVFAVSAVLVAVRLGMPVVTGLVAVAAGIGILSKAQRQGGGNHQKGEPIGFHVNLLGLC